MQWDRLLRMKKVMSLSVFSKKRQTPQRSPAPSQKVWLADLKSKGSIYYNSFSYSLGRGAKHLVLNELSPISETCPTFYYQDKQHS